MRCAEKRPNIWRLSPPGRRPNRIRKVNVAECLMPRYRVSPNCFRISATGSQHAASGQLGTKLKSAMGCCTPPNTPLRDKNWTVPATPGIPIRFMSLHRMAALEAFYAKV